MYSLNEFWDRIFEKLKILEHLEKEEYFALSRTDCSMVFNNGFKIRLEKYFIFSSMNDLPEVFKQNNLILLQKYKSTFSICYADNYYYLPELNYDAKVFKNTISVISKKSFLNDHLAYGLALVNYGVFEDVLISNNGQKLNLTEIYLFNSPLSETKDIKVIYTDIRTQKTWLMKIGYVKLYYDFILEDESTLFCVRVHDKYSNSINKSLLFNILSTFKELTNKKIVFIEIYKESKSNTLYELVFQNENDINSIESINEIKFNLNVEEYVNESKKFILTDQKTEYFITRDKVPFPQANDFEKVIKYCDLIYNNKKNLQELINELGVTSRQVIYYKDSCLFLSLIREQEGQVFLNPNLSKIYREGTVKQKYEYFVESIIENEILFKCYNLFVDDKLNITNFKNVVGSEYIMSESTLKRRLSTINSWFKWLSRIIELNKKNINYESTEIGLIEQVKRIVYNSNSKRVRMFVLKDELRTSLEYELDEKELMRKIKRSEMYFSEELQILFETREDYYNYLK